MNTIISLRKKIKNIKNKKNKYILSNSKDLFNYFEIKQNIDKNNNPTKTINKFFNINDISEKEKQINWYNK